MHDEGTGFAPRTRIAVHIAESPAFRRRRQDRDQPLGRAWIGRYRCLALLVQDQKVEGRSRREVAGPVGSEGNDRDLVRQPRRRAAHDRVRHAAERPSGIRRVDPVPKDVHGDLEPAGVRPGGRAVDRRLQVSLTHQVRNLRHEEPPVRKQAEEVRG